LGLAALALASCDVNQKSSPSPNDAGEKPAAPAGSEAPKAASTPSPAPAAGATGAAAAPSTTPTPAPAPAPDAGTNEYVVLSVRGGELVIELADADAPKHAANFRQLVQSGFYNGKGFHRVIEGFVAQAGDPNPQGDGTGSQGAPIPSEAKLPNKKGAVGMARDVDPQSNPTRMSYGSQFYICLDDQPSLDAQGFTVFGRVVRGLELAGAIQRGDFDVNNGIVPASQRTRIDRAELRRLPAIPAPSSSASPTPVSPIPSPASSADEYAELETNIGKIYIDVFETETPKHAANFKKLVREGFYNGLTFHRVIDGFMAQGGDPAGNGSGGPGYTIDNEIKLKHLRGSVAAARLPDGGNPERKSSGSQFFICFAPQGSLDIGGYTVFGHVVKGMDVVDRITRGPREQNGAVPNDQRTKIVKARLVPAAEVQVESPSPAK
jgi:cyclophilin family peptidyl-prolyl cis-trans isomerase